jgi:cell division protease FtsH
MDEKNKNKSPLPNNDYGFFRIWIFWIFIFLGVIWISNYFSSDSGGLVKKLNYSDFYSRVEKNPLTPSIKNAHWSGDMVQGDLVKDEEGKKKYYVYVPAEDKDLLEALRKNIGDFEVDPPKTLWSNLFYSMGPMILFILFLWYFSYKGNQMGSKVWGFGKARVQRVEKEGNKITFKDVAGIDEAKDELREVIDFLKDPKKFQKLGGRIPKGVILVGPPGCGKTLLAKAVAGEADVPFFNISGSDFVEMFVGVGASRVRDLFDQAKKAALTLKRGGIIFIDEIDAVGRQRFAGVGGGHDEREQTLNQLLVEMDGFQTEEGIIVMAATNRPDVLDPALLRPGRFDRHIVIDAPDIKGREEILKVHSKKIKLSLEADLSVIAKQTPGFSGADLANLCNEAALLAARRNKESIELPELQEAMERVIAGPERKSRVISKKEKEIKAYHESGHAILHLLLEHVDPLHKVSIIPRGYGVGGYTMPLPQEDKHIMAKSQFIDELCVLLGGRVAEEVFLNEVTTGAYSDLKRATDIARRMVTEYGMSERIGHISLVSKEGPVFLGRDWAEHKEYAEDTAKLIDSEVKVLVEEAYSRAKNLISSNSQAVKNLALKLIEKEVLLAQEVKEVTGLKIDENNTPANQG